jgi:hypothetical protein
MTTQRTPEFPDRLNDNYVQNVLSYGVHEDDLDLPNTMKDILRKNLVLCNEFVVTWADCSKVVADCNKLMKSTTDELSKDNGDLILAYDMLWEVRQRLAQAWSSCTKKSKHQVIGLSMWLGCVFVGCAFLLVWLKLLPGWTPKVAADNTDIAVLFSSFLFGAIGGIFDAASALSINYTEQTFDAGHWVWYIFSPVLGGILGIVVFAVILAGLLTTTGGGVSSTSNTTAVTPAIAATNPSTVKAAFILSVAFIAGFKQIVVIGFLERLAVTVFGGSGESKAKS